MKFLGNIIWLLFGGIITSVEYLISSLILMITIIGIPFGLQTLKLAILALWPFWQPCRRRGEFRRMLVTYHEHYLDIRRRLLDLPYASGIGLLLCIRSSASLSACNILRWQL